MNCRVCGIELNNENWHTSGKKYCNYICKICRSLESKTYQINMSNTSKNKKG